MGGRVADGLWQIADGLLFAENVSWNSGDCVIIYVENDSVKALAYAKGVLVNLSTNGKRITE